MDDAKIKEYRKRIKKLGVWYQPIEFVHGLRTPSKYSYNSSVYGIKNDNRIENLKLFKNVGIHQSLHNQKKI